uniref:Uncharacterized protein n=1 Tax=Ananas comosus var. bracteatus TaxID=296719 RepID=A0A6V7QHS5_ANACO|nr:unnamed protein product [Ananas comosus var. bracteatus]
MVGEVRTCKHVSPPSGYRKPKKARSTHRIRRSYTTTRVSGNIVQSSTYNISMDNNKRARVRNHHRACTTVPTSDRSTHLYNCRACLLTAKERQQDLWRVHWLGPVEVELGWIAVGAWIDADVAPRSRSSTRASWWLRSEAGRAWISAVLDIALDL